VIGKNLTLTGGNFIGIRDHCNYAELKIGDNCTMGANSVILGPIYLSNGINI
jgi:serine acetyltransferase